MKKILFILLLTTPFIGFGQSIGYYCSSGGNIYKTTDSGVNWSYQGYTGSGSGQGISFLNTTTGYYCSSGGNIYKTTDSGVNWSYQGYTGSGSGQGISFLNTTTSSTFNIPTQSSKRKLEKIVDVLGRKTKPQTNTPFIKIYDDGNTEKKLIIEE